MLYPYYSLAVHKSELLASSVQVAIGIKIQMCQGHSVDGAVETIEAILYRQACQVDLNRLVALQALLQVTREVVARKPEEEVPTR